MNYNQIRWDILNFYNSIKVPIKINSQITSVNNEFNKKKVAQVYWRIYSIQIVLNWALIGLFFITDAFQWSHQLAIIFHHLFPINYKKIHKFSVWKAPQKNSFIYPKVYWTRCSKFGNIFKIYYSQNLLRTIRSL